MFHQSVSMILCLLLSCLIMAVCWTLSIKMHKDRDKSTPFECGFDPKGSARVPFSTRFFILAVLFLLFDIEIVLLLPLPMMLCMYPKPLCTLMLLIAILLLGLFHEWREGSLEWAN